VDPGGGWREGDGCGRACGLFLYAQLAGFSKPARVVSVRPKSLCVPISLRFKVSGLADLLLRCLLAFFRQ